MLKTARIKANKIIQAAWGPVPKTIGMNHMKITPPTSTEPPEKAAATTKISTPTKTVKNPAINIEKSFLNSLSFLFFSFSVKVTTHSPLFEHQVKEHHGNYKQYCEG
jgi:hypothetical protein